MGRLKKYATKRTPVLFSIDAGEKARFEDLARAEHYPSFNEFILTCLREHASFAKSAEELEAQATVLAGEAKQHEAIAQQKKEQAEQTSQRVLAIKTLTQRNDGKYQVELERAIKSVVAALDRNKERGVAEGQAQVLRERFSVGLTAEDLLAKAYERTRTGGMFR